MIQRAPSSNEGTISTGSESQQGLLKAFLQGQQEPQALAQQARVMKSGFSKLFEALIDVFAFGPLLLVRHSFGTRFLSWIKLFLSLVAVSVCAPASVLANLHALAILVAFCAHKFRGNKATKDGSAWHSRCPGLHYGFVLQWIPDDAELRHTWTPFSVILLGGVIALFDVFGFFLAGCGVAIAFSSHLDYTRMKNKILDAIDGQIESKHMASALKGQTTPRATQGFVAPSAGRYRGEELAFVEAEYIRERGLA